MKGENVLVEKKEKGWGKKECQPSTLHTHMPKTELKCHTVKKLPTSQDLRILLPGSAHIPFIV